MGNPKVSLIILSMNPSQRLFEEIKKQTFQDFEIIVADDKGFANGYISGLKKSNGEIFVRIDDDVSLPNGWLEKLIKPFEDKSIAGVTGPTFVPKERRHYRDSIRWAENPKGILKWLYDNNQFRPSGIRGCGCVSYDSNFEEKFYDYGNFSWDDYEPDHLEGTNFAMRTDLMRKVGGFDPRFDGVSEWLDDDLVFKVKKLGYRLSYNPEAYLYHMLGKGEHFNERFEGFGRIKNFLRFHWRHGRHRFLNIKFYVYLTIWIGYFIWKRFQKL